MTPLFLFLFFLSGKTALGEEASDVGRDEGCNVGATGSATAMLPKGGFGFVGGVKFLWEKGDLKNYCKPHDVSTC